MPWPLDTTLPTPGACVAAFLGAYSQGNPAKTWLTDTNPFRRVWKCGADALTSPAEDMVMPIDVRFADRDNRTYELPPDWNVVGITVFRKEVAHLLNAISCLLCSLMSTRANRNRVVYALHRLLAPSDLSARAASLAALMRSQNPAKAFAQAQSTLKALPLSSFTSTIFDVNRQAATRSLTQRCAMGSIDAFVSHAWIDDANSKAEPLQRWFANLPNRSASPREEAEEGRTEPLLWIDVACLNQFNIQTDLLCLPFFILASKQFVGLVGPHYPNRLWCLMEVFFVFELREGKGDNEKPCVMLDLSQTQDGIPVADIFGTFDAKKAQCHELKDRDHLLAIIESSFGSLRRFNRIVHSLKLN